MAAQKVRDISVWHKVFRCPRIYIYIYIETRDVQELIDNMMEHLATFMSIQICLTIVAPVKSCHSDCLLCRRHIE